MALFDIKLFSTTLLTNTDVRVIVPTPDEPFLPDDTPYYKEGVKYQVLYLLHGMFGDCTVWSRNTGIERYAQEHKLIVVSASVTNSMYLDMTYGSKFLTYMTKELPAFINGMFPVSTKREDTFIAGMSMGGYGAWRVALEKPENYSCAVSLSGALSGKLTKTVKFMTSAVSEVCFEAIYGLGEAREQKIEENDLLHLIEKLKSEGRTLPHLFQCCGTEDFVYAANTEMKEKLESMDLEYTYEESPGEHNWDYWDPQIRRVLDNWLPLKNKLIENQEEEQI